MTDVRVNIRFQLDLGYWLSSVALWPGGSTRWGALDTPYVPNRLSTRFISTVERLTIGSRAGLYVAGATDRLEKASVGAINPEGMPVILTSQEEVQTWITAPADEALKLQRPLQRLGHTSHASCPPAFRQNNG